MIVDKKAPAFTLSPANTAAFVIQKEVQTVAWEQLPRHRSQLVLSSHPPFMRLQKAMSNVKSEPETRRACMGAIHEYRAALDKYVRSIEDEDEVVLFMTASSLLLLTEKLFLITHEKNSLIIALMEWLDLARPEPEWQEKARTVVKQLIPRHHQDFWPLVHRLVLRGHFLDAIRMLETGNGHGMPMEPSHKQAVVALKRVNEALHRQGSLQDFAAGWKACHLEIKAFYDQCKGTEAETVLGILAADSELIFRKSSCWQEALFAWLLHSLPVPTLKHVREYASTIEKSFKIEDIAEQLQLCLLKEDIFGVVRKASELDAWFVAHFVDLLDAMDKFGQVEQVQEVDMRERFLFDYATILVSSRRFFAVGADYLMTCPKQGRDALSAFITCVEPRDHHEFRKLLHVCSLYRLTEEAKTVKQARLMALYRKKRYGEAIALALQVKNEKVAQSLVFCLIKDASRPSSEISLEKVIESFSPSEIETNELLSVLEQFSAYRRHIQAKQYEDAAKIMIKMLAFKTAPFELWPILLPNAIEGLENKKLLVYSQEDTLELLRCLYEVQMSPRRNDLLSFWAENEEEHKKMQLDLDRLRRACSLNLARVCLY